MTTELLQQQTAQGIERPILIRDGIAGNYQVIYAMVRMIRHSVKYDKGLELFAKGKAQKHFASSTTLFGREGYNSHITPKLTFNTIFNYVKRNIEYTLDQAGAVESIKSASVTLSDRFGDCDDQTILIASLLGVLGFEDVRIAMARYSPDSASFEHVYAVCYENGKRYVFDTTLPGAQLNSEVQYYELKEIPVFAELEGLDGFSGLFGNAVYYAKTGLRKGLTVIPDAAGILPIGFAPATALSLSANMFRTRKGETLSLPATASKINRQLDEVIKQLLDAHIAYDSAKAYALAKAAELNAVEVKAGDKRNYEIVKRSIQDKLRFINNFEEFARVNNIPCVYLDSRMILLAALGLTAFSGYAIYKQFKKVEV